MKRMTKILAMTGLAAAMTGGLALAAGNHGAGQGDHMDTPGAMPGMATGGVEELMEQHRGHLHEHDFEAMEEMSPEQRTRMMALMQEIGIAMPPMDSARGRVLFVERGCVACHAVNGVGGDLGPALDADEMPRPMNAFEFSARMWRGAQSMVALQEDMLGEVISLSGQDLADLVAFAHDEDEQARLTGEQVPERLQKVIDGE